MCKSHPNYQESEIGPNLAFAALGFTAKRKGNRKKIQINTNKYWQMLTSRCLHISTSQANLYQLDTEYWQSLCKTHKQFTPNSYTLHISPISKTLLEHNKKTIETITKNTPKIRRPLQASSVLEFDGSSELINHHQSTIHLSNSSMNVLTHPLTDHTITNH